MAANFLRCSTASGDGQSYSDTSQCNAIHRSIVEQFKTAIVYGKSVKHQPQRVGLAHELADEDIGECFPECSLARRHRAVVWGHALRC